MYKYFFILLFVMSTGVFFGIWYPVANDLDRPLLSVIFICGMIFFAAVGAVYVIVKTSINNYEYRKEHEKKHLKWQKIKDLSTLYYPELFLLIEKIRSRNNKELKVLQNGVTLAKAVYKNNPSVENNESFVKSICVYYDCILDLTEPTAKKVKEMLLELEYIKPSLKIELIADICYLEDINQDISSIRRSSWFYAMSEQYYLNYEVINAPFKEDFLLHLEELLLEIRGRTKESAERFGSTL